MANPDENRITFFGITDTRGKKTPFGIRASDRTRHVYVIGKTGMGKSTLLENMAIQDIQNGEGMAFIDPHGKSAEYLLDYVPENRIKDVLYFAPFDMANPISFNIMEDIGPDKRHLVVSGLMSVFKKIWVDAWSARMEYILQNTLLALLEYPGATLLGVNRMLSDKEYRKKVVENIQDPATRSFWVDEFAKYTERFAAEAVPAIQNKVGQFTSNPLIRNVIGQPKSTFDLREIMDKKKIVIVNLSKGLVGEGNASLLGSMLITKIYLAALSRADASQVSMGKLPNFYMYVDEFQSFANESFADILSEARKYKLNLTVAHQYVEQMSEEVRAAVFGNVGTMIVFRVGPFDAEIFEKEFMPTFTAEDFVNLGKYQMYLKLMIDGVGSSPFSSMSMPPIEQPKVSHKESVIANSRLIFGRVRKDAEDEIGRQLPDNSVDKNSQKNSPREERSREPYSQGGGGRVSQQSSSFKQGGERPSQVGGPRHIDALRSVLTSALTGEAVLPVQSVQQVQKNEPQKVEIKKENKEPFRGTLPQRSEPLKVVKKEEMRVEKRIPPKNLSQTRPKLENEGTSLKEALGELLAKNKPLATSKGDTKEKEVPQKKQPSSQHPNEIPEADLRKMLEVPEKE